jgi:hypothetical protein
MSLTAKKALLSLSDLTPKQAEAVDFCFERDEGILMVPVGFGKTVVSQTAAQELLAECTVGRVLVVAPLRVCNDVWAVEWQKWEHLDRVAVATGTADHRAAVIEGDARIVVINFEVLPWFFENYAGRFDGLIIDELTKFKAGGAQFKALRKHIKSFTWRIGMTGTLAEEGVEGIFYQTMAIDGGRTFGKNKSKWMARYFYPDWNGITWTLMDDGAEKVAAMIKHLVFRSDVVENMPVLMQDVVHLKMPPSAREVYDEMRRENIVGDIEAVNAAVLSGKLEQIANGFLYGGDELHTIKREWSGWDEGGQILIAYRFVHDLEVLRTLFPNGQELRDSDSVVSEWNSGELRVLFIHPASGGHGLNLQVSGCSRIIFYSPIWSRDQTDQVIGRVHRRGNPSQFVRVTTLVSENTVEDKVMLPRLAGKGEVAELFRAHLKSG